MKRASFMGLALALALALGALTAQADKPSKAEGLKRVTQELQVHHVSGLSVHRSLYGDVHLVVVSMPIRVGTVSEDLRVRLVRPLRPVESMGGREMDTSSHANHGHGLASLKSRLDDGTSGYPWTPLQIRGEHPPDVRKGRHPKTPAPRYVPKGFY